jgi:hypothetical protein
MSGRNRVKALELHLLADACAFFLLFKAIELSRYECEVEASGHL